MLIHHSAGLHN